MYLKMKRKNYLNWNGKIEEFNDALFQNTISFMLPWYSILKKNLQYKFSYYFMQRAPNIVLYKCTCTFQFLSTIIFIFLNIIDDRPTATSH
jgi:hypothetical protein